MEKLKRYNGIFLMLILSISLAHCKKIKEDLGKKFIIDVMTSGSWVVNKYTGNDVDSTSAFDDYTFQFTEDGKVYAIKTTGNEEGTWVGDTNNLTIYAHFPAANDTLQKLNETWKITNNTTKLVEAKPFNSGRVAYLKLIKKV